MRFSAAKGHKIVSTSTAETVGRVEGFVVDPTAHAVVALEVKKAADGDTLRWADLTAFGADAVTVTGAERVTAADEHVAPLAGKDHHLLGKRVLSSAGDEIGKLDDVEFDTESGVLTALLVGGHEIPGASLLGVGSYAVVVAAP